MTLFTQRLSMYQIEESDWPLFLGAVDLSRLNLQQFVWYLGKAEPV
ncbi:hypothetical protein V6260_10910 [Pseudoalteromonas aliena]